MLPEKARRYPYIALESSPIIMTQLISDRPADDPFWDFTPDPQRFTFRFVLAHLADWDEIFADRVKLTLAEPDPTLPDMDEGRIAIERDYAHQDPLANFARWRSNRAKLLSYLQSIPTDSFDRKALRPELGWISITGWLALIPGHDMYHLRQAVDYTAAFKP